MKNFVFIVLLALLLGTSVVRLIMLDPWMNSKAEASAPPSEAQVTVQQGDTLWSIASRYNHNQHVSIQEMVDLIIADNHLSKSSIRPGQVLTISQHP